jgi:lincosamide nucleotidyltransferase A/C/D/E
MPRPSNTEMTSSAVIELLELLDSAGLSIWLDGGWGIDALLGSQSRPHADLDILVAVADVPRLLEVVGRRGFAIVEGAPPHAFVLADSAARQIDVHAVTFEARGALHRMENGGDWHFPAGSFAGCGVVADRNVRCLSPAAQVLCHAQGYPPAEKDLHDMALLRERFGVELPASLLGVERS